MPYVHTGFRIALYSNNCLSSGLVIIAVDCHFSGLNSALTMNIFLYENEVEINAYDGFRD